MKILRFIVYSHQSSISSIKLLPLDGENLHKVLDHQSIIVKCNKDNKKVKIEQSKKDINQYN